MYFSKQLQIQTGTTKTARKFIKVLLPFVLPTSGAPITIRKWRLRCKSHNVTCGFSRRDRRKVFSYFYLWRIYGISSMPSSESFRERISEAMANVCDSQLRSAWDELEYALTFTELINGAYIQHLQIYFMSFHAVFKLFHVVFCDSFANTPISFPSNHV